MPVYKGNAEVTSGSLKKGATNIENGYKQTDQFYVNTNAITINFVDAISGATMSTTQFSSIGTPGTAFSSFTRTISVDSGRVWLSNPTVSESGDTGGNVNASISGITSTSATLNVSGTHPNTGITVTLTVNGSTQVDLPNLNVTQDGNFPRVSTADGGSLNTVNYSVSNSSGCSGGTSGSGSYNFGSSSSGTWYSYSRPGLAPGPYGNGCGVTCNSSVSFSKSGYDSGGVTFSDTGGYPSSSGTVTANITCFNSYGGFYSCPTSPQSVSVTCSGTSCDPNNNPPAAGTCSGQTSGMPTWDTNNFYLNQGGSPIYVSGATSGGSWSGQYTLSYISPNWVVTCPNNGAGLTEAQLESQCSLVQSGTNVTVTWNSGPFINSSGDCNPSNPPLICGSGSWNTINGAPTPSINLGCSRPTCV